MSNKQTYGVTVPTSIFYNDEKSKSFWQTIREAILRGDDVVAHFKSVSATIDAGTLASKGSDDQGHPLFGVGSDTRLSLSLGMEIEVTPKPLGSTEVSLTIPIPTPTA